MRVWLSDRSDEGGLLMCVELDGERVAYFEWNGSFTVHDFVEADGYCRIPREQPGGWRLAEESGS